MGSVGREQSGFASIRAREVASQNSKRPGERDEGGSRSADVRLAAAVEGGCSHLRWLLKARHMRVKSRTGSRTVLVLRMVIMLGEGWGVHDGKVDGCKHALRAQCHRGIEFCGSRVALLRPVAPRHIEIALTLT